MFYFFDSQEKRFTKEDDRKAEGFSKTNFSIRRKKDEEKNAKCFACCNHVL